MRILFSMMVAVFFLSNKGFASEASNSKIIIDGKEYPLKVICESENRSSTSKGQAKIKVQIEGLQKGWVFAKVELAKAVDDTDKDLINNNAIELNDSFGSFLRSNQEPYFSFRLKQSNRAAKEIKEINGTLHLQNSGEGSPVILPDFRKTGGEYIKNEELKKQEITIAYIDKKTFDKKGSKLIMDSIFPKSVNKDDPNIKDSLAQMKMTCTKDSLVTLIVNDPEQQILKIEAIDPKTKKSVKGIKSLGSIVMIPVNLHLSPKEEKPEYSILKIYIKDEQLLQKVPFKFKNIKLP